jgi:hypothetical protein
MTSLGAARVADCPHLRGEVPGRSGRSVTWETPHNAPVRDPPRIGEAVELRKQFWGSLNRHG